MANAPKVSKAAMLKAASKKLPIKGDKALREELQWFTDDVAEAYRVGAEAAQSEIVARLHRLATTEPTP